MRDPAGRPRFAWSGWEKFCGLTVLVITLSYLTLIASCLIYLGWNDAAHFFTHPRLWARLGLTVWTAAIATVIASFVAIPAGYALSRFSPPCPHLIATLIDLPVMVPAATVGVFMFGFVGSFPLGPILDKLGVELAHHTAGVVLCQVAVTVAFGVRLSKAVFDAIPTRYETIARSLGASRSRAFRLITLPLAARGLIAAILVVFARAAAEWEALMLFVGATQGSTDTLPLAVYLDFYSGKMGWVTSMSLVCVFMAVSVIGVVRVIEGRTNVW